MNVAVGTRAKSAKLQVVPPTQHIGAEARGIDLREKPDEQTVHAIIRPGSTISY